jgi:hypothetical protein
MCFLAEAVCSKLLTLATRLKRSTAKWAADRFKKGHQASNPASTRALLQPSIAFS